MLTCRSAGGREGLSLEAGCKGCCSRDAAHAEGGCGLIGLM